MQKLAGVKKGDKKRDREEEKNKWDQAKSVKLARRVPFPFPFCPRKWNP